MKIKDIIHQDKTKRLYSIAHAGLSFGLTIALLKTGILDYDAMIDFEKIKDTLNNINLGPFSHIDINIIYSLVKSGITTFGINTIIVASKGINFAKEAVKPLLESEAVQNNPKIIKINEILKGKNYKEKAAEKVNKPKALIHLAKKGLAFGLKVSMIASGNIDYNSIYDLSNLPHKFTKIANIAENIDLNKIEIGKETFSILHQFILERNDEKKKGIPLFRKITFKDILANIFKEFPRYFGSQSMISPIDPINIGSSVTPLPLPKTKDIQGGR